MQHQDIPLSTAQWRREIDAELRRPGRRRRRGRTLAAVVAMALALGGVAVARSAPSDEATVAAPSPTPSPSPPVPTTTVVAPTSAPAPATSAATTVPTASILDPIPTPAPIAPAVAPAPPPAPAAPATTAATAPEPVADPAPLDGCDLAGEPWGERAGEAPLRRLAFGGGTIVLAPDVAPDPPAPAVQAVASTPDATTVVAVAVGPAGSAQLLVGSGTAAMARVVTADEIAHPAVSPSGGRLAWVADGRLVVASRDGDDPTPLAVPVRASRPAFVGFVDNDRLLLTVEEAASGASLEAASRSEVWIYDLASEVWTRVTGDQPEFGDWSLARTPVAVSDDALLYVRQVGSPNGGGAVRTELRRVSGIRGSEVTESTVGEVADGALLVAAAADGTTLWNVPGADGRTHLVERTEDGAPTAIGCGRTRHGSAPPVVPAAGAVVVPADVDGPDPFVVIDAGRPWVFTTNTRQGNVPVATVGPDGTTVVADALPVLPPWAAGGFTWAPAVAATIDGWTLWFTARHHASGRQCIGAARAERPDGPYRAEPAPLVCDVDSGGSIDASPVDDRTEGLVLLYKSDGNCCGLPTAIHAVALDATGTVVMGEPVELVRADRAWEGGVVEAPSMIYGPDGSWWLLYSAHRWASSHYVLGAARCDSAMGPCRKQDAPALDDDGHPGAGGAEFVASAPLVVLHEWEPGRVGYEAGGRRAVRLGRVEDACGRLRVLIVAETASWPGGSCS